MSGRHSLLAPTSFAPDDGSWRARIDSDGGQIDSRVPLHLKGLHSAVVTRAAAGSARSLILSGSTARGSRTAISDLDYHLIGLPIDTSDLSRELDLHVLSVQELKAHLLAGDDFVQWSLRFGLVVFDHGPAENAMTLIMRRALWPDPARKREHAAKSLGFARRFVATGDRDGAILQVRTALSLAARAHLLGLKIFPLSRAELPDQLRAVGRGEAAAALTSSIRAAPSLDELEEAVTLGDQLLAGARASNHGRR